MNLYIIRHAIAVDEGTPEYEDDSQRPLTDKGKKKMRLIAKGLRSIGVNLTSLFPALMSARVRRLKFWPRYSRRRKLHSVRIWSRWVIPIY